MTGSVAFVLGTSIYVKWGSTASLWIWVPGLAGFGWWSLLGGRGLTLYEDPDRMVLAFVSLRLVAYSAGALCCAIWRKPAASTVASDAAAE